MASFNRVFILGNLTKDPELRVTPTTGLAICKFTVATNRTLKSEDGGTKDEATFIDIECFGKSAENISKFFTKGKPIFIEGRLRLNEWESKNSSGQSEKRSKLMVVLERFEFIGTKGSSEPETSQSPYEAVSPQKSTFSANTKTPKSSLDPVPYEDIPF